MLAHLPTAGRLGSAPPNEDHCAPVCDEEGRCALVEPQEVPRFIARFGYSFADETHIRSGGWHAPTVGADVPEGDNQFSSSGESPGPEGTPLHAHDYFPVPMRQPKRRNGSWVLGSCPACKSGDMSLDCVNEPPTCPAWSCSKGMPCALGDGRSYEPCDCIRITGMPQAPGRMDTIRPASAESYVGAPSPHTAGDGVAWDVMTATVANGDGGLMQRIVQHEQDARLVHAIVESELPAFDKAPIAVAPSATPAEQVSSAELVRCLAGDMSPQESVQLLRSIVAMCPRLPQPPAPEYPGRAYDDRGHGPSDYVTEVRRLCMLLRYQPLAAEVIEINVDPSGKYTLQVTLTCVPMADAVTGAQRVSVSSDEFTPKPHPKAEWAAAGATVVWKRADAEREMRKRLIERLRTEPWLHPPPPAPVNAVDWTDLGRVFSELLPVYVFEKPPEEWFGVPRDMSFDYEGERPRGTK